MVPVRQPKNVEELRRNVVEELRRNAVEELLNVIRNVVNVPNVEQQKHDVEYLRHCDNFVSFGDKKSSIHRSKCTPFRSLHTSLVCMKFRDFCLQVFAFY